jgi:hypothetical protein
MDVGQQGCYLPLRSQWPLGNLQAKVESRISRDPCDLGYLPGRSHQPGRQMDSLLLHREHHCPGERRLDTPTAHPRQLMRIPVTGGPPEQVLTARLYGTPWCARSPSTLCAFAEQAPDAKELVFTAFDPIRGKGHELVRFATDPNAGYRNWSLSPDGTRIGIIKTGSESHICASAGRILST